jgi:hypothetical protein
MRCILKKLRTILLFIAVALFCGRELVHPFFHGDTCCTHSCTVIEQKESHSAEFTHSDSAEMLNVSELCPLCSSFSNKAYVFNPDGLPVLELYSDFQPIKYQPFKSLSSGIQPARAPPVNIP